MANNEADKLCRMYDADYTVGTEGVAMMGGDLAQRTRSSEAQKAFDAGPEAYGDFCRAQEAAAIHSFPAEADPNGLDPHTKGAKLDAGKVRPSLIFSSMSRALVEVAKVGTYGAKKYSDGGWQYVENGVARYTDAMDRHRLWEPIEGNDRDTDLLHAAHLAWNALARLELMLREREIA